MSGVRPIFQFCFILLEMEEIDSRANKNDCIVSQYDQEHYTSAIILIYCTE